jgi:drug/metabolite transporter (DMT)-like permease
MTRDHLKLQFIIILWGFTAVLGALITLEAASLVLYRTAIAALVLALWQHHRLRLPRKYAVQFTLTGFIIGAHWITFFLAVKIANVSICMVGIATLSLWTALIEPLMIKRRKFRPIDLILSIVVGLGVTIIFLSEVQFSLGILIALLSALLAAIFSVVNCYHIRKAGHLVITTYEMAGAALFCAIYIALFDRQISLIPTTQDWLWLIILSVFCTVIAFSQYVELLKRVPVFTMNFASNLEPVYGILLAALILHDYRFLNSGFYLGAAIIIISMLAYPLLRKKFVLPTSEKLD